MHWKPYAQRMASYQSSSKTTLPAKYTVCVNHSSSQMNGTTFSFDIALLATILHPRELPPRRSLVVQAFVQKGLAPAFSRLAREAVEKSDPSNNLQRGQKEQVSRAVINLA